MPDGQLSSEDQISLQLLSLHRPGHGRCEIIIKEDTVPSQVLFLSFPKIFNCQGDLCGENDVSCLRNISLTERAADCPNKCQGIIIEVRKESVQRYQEEGFKDLLNEYQNYECENYTDLFFTDKISGIYYYYHHIIRKMIFVYSHLMSRSEIQKQPPFHSSLLPNLKFRQDHQGKSVV